jgi:hypothetical protein
MSASVPAVIEPTDFTVIATSPKDMEASQRLLIAWAEHKIQSIGVELAEAQLQLKLAKEHKWNTAGWRSQVSKIERRSQFYLKIKLAVEAGYYIVPPFPMDIFAIRVNRALPHEYLGTNSDNHNQPPEVLTAGEGRYVDPRPIRESFPDEEMRGGKMVPVTQYFAVDYQDVDFPFKLARAEIREATDKALALKIFDTLGVLPRVRSPDPIICGQIYYPTVKPYRRYEYNKAVNFFVAWWLDTRTIRPK